MTLRGLLLPLLLGPAFVTGCIATKDMGEDDTETGSESGTSDAMSGDGAPTTDQTTGPTTSQMTGDDAGTTAQVTDDAGTTAEDDAATTLATTDEGGSDSSTAGSDDQADCEATGGTWEPTSCGHYGCGAPPACAAVIPGCDCGPAMNFVDGTGCVEDPACLQATFECGELECTVATEYCEVFHPGVKGPTTYSCNALPAACVVQSTCMCLDDEGVSGPGQECTELQGGGLQVELFAP